MSSNASLIPQIRDAYKKVLEASKGTLEFAIKCGDLLNVAKEGMQDKAWLSWLRDNFPEIPQTTASLYMRLAKNQDLFDKQRVASEAKGGLLSIRSAAKLIPQTEAGAKAAATRAAAKEAAKAASAKQTPASRAAFDLPELLAAVAPDEVVTALHQAKWERDAVEELISLLRAELDATHESKLPQMPPSTSTGRRTIATA